MSLVLRHNGEIVAQVPAGGWFRLPDGRAISPAMAGWSDDQGYSLEEIEAELERSAMSLSFAQLLIGLVTEAWISEEEGEAWLSGTLPSAIEALIAAMPEDQRFAARARATRPSIVMRLDGTVVALAAAQGKTPEQLDTFFATYAQV